MMIPQGSASVRTEAVQAGNIYDDASTLNHNTGGHNVEA